MAKNIWDISENSLVNVIMVTTREGQSWTIRDAGGGVNPERPGRKWLYIFVGLVQLLIQSVRGVNL